MWAAFRSDLKEFVTTAAAEGTEALSAIDSKLTDEDIARTENKNNANEIGKQSGSGENADVVVGADGDVTYINTGYDNTGLVQSALDEAARRRETEETYTVPLVPGGEWPEDGKLMSGRNFVEGTVAKDEKESDEEKSAKEKMEGATAAKTEAEIPVDDDLISSPSTPADDPAYTEIRQFIESFDIATKTDEISVVLERYPDSVQPHFQSLVPTTVTYKQFWVRYFYRCDASRIEAEWELEREAARKARKEAIAGSISSVKNMLGSAVSAVSHVVAPEEKREGAYEKYQAQHREQEAAAAAGSGISEALFGKGGRPPFVMNTAVSDVDDNAVDESEEEEELGWDDDDDEEEEEDGHESGNDTVNESKEAEEIVFSSPAEKGETATEELEALKSQLSQVEEEREILHQTVEMQSKEIAELKLQGSGPAVGVAAAPSEEDAAIKGEIDKLKMQIFEKDSELAALRASLDDTHEDSRTSAVKKSEAKIAAQDRELEKMQVELLEKDNEIARLKEAIASSAPEVEEARSEATESKEALHEMQEAVNKLRSELEAAREAMIKSEAESQTLRDSLASSANSSSTAAEEAKKERAILEEKVKALTAKLESTQKNLEFTTRRADFLEQELEKTREEMTNQNLNFASTLEEEVTKVRAEAMEEAAAAGASAAVAAAPAAVAASEDESSGSPSSYSSGVKVPNSSMASAASPLAAKLAVDDEDDEDDWGDGWGDEDD